jgi:beta-galactosidase
MGASASTGGFSNNNGGAGALSMNCDEVKEAVKAFLTALASRYKGHPGLLGYDIWNEVNYSPDVDYSEYSKAAYREWLKTKYGDLDTLAEARYQYSYSDWDDIDPPHEVAAYVENLDWLAFKRDNYYAQMQFKIDTIRAIDPDCLIAAHGVGGAIPDMASRGADDWLAASKVEIYGLTWVPGRRGFKPWQNFFGPDLTRAAAHEKKWWHAERPGGPLWLQPQVLGHDKEDGRVMEPEDIRLLTMTSFACGATGILNLRYRPLLDGPLFGAFGSYGMDGSRTPRSEMASTLAKWANAPEQKPLFEARPMRGDIGLLVIPEAQAWDDLLTFHNAPDTYRAAMWGAYRGFFDNGLQPDWVHVDDIAGYETIYAPYPIMMTAETAQKLARWVEQGGTLISEATPGYFGNRGKVGTVQPNNGLDKVFGVREDEVEFMPDIADRYRFGFRGDTVQCGGFLQSYTLEGAKEVGRFEDGRLAAAEHAYGKGRTLLGGSHPGGAYFRNSSDGNRNYFAKACAWTGKRQHIEISTPLMQARLHEGPIGRVLWLFNPTREDQRATVLLDGKAATPGQVFWGRVEGAGSFTVPPRDVLVVQV